MKHMTKRALAMLLVLVTVLTVFPVMTSTATAAEPEGNLTAEELYVKDGATLWLTPSQGLDLAAGTWTSQVGDLVATIKGGEYNADSNKTGWRLNAQGVPYYRLQSMETFRDNRKNVGIVFPVEAISDGDFTFETVYTPLYVSGEDGVVVPHTTANIPSTWGAYAQGVHSMFSIAGLQFCFFHPSTSGSGNSSRMRIYYHPAAWEATSPTYGCPNNKVSKADLVPFGGYDAETNTLTTTPVTMSVVRRVAYKDAVAAPSIVYDITRFQVELNGVSHLGGNSGDGRTLIPNDLSSALDRPFYTLEMLKDEGGNNEPFSGFFGFPAEVYAVRVYNRALTRDEVNVNHLADLISILSAEISKSFYYGLSDVDRLSLLDAMSRIRIQDGKAAVTAAVESFKSELSTIALTDYDRLYVKAGLVQLFSAFTKSEADAVIANQKWENKATAGKDAILYGGKYDAESNIWGWKALANGGIGYDVTGTELNTGKAAGVYIDLGSGVVNTARNYTVEYVSNIKRTSDGNNQAGPTSYITEKFGAWGTFGYKDADWRAIFNSYGKTPHWGHGIGWYNGCDSSIFTPGTVQTLSNSITHQINQGVEDSSRAIFSNAVAKNRFSNVIASGKGPYTDVCQDFYLMRNVANETYAIRVYNRALTDEEILRNSVVDRWAYNGITVSSLAGKPDAIVMHAVNACKSLPLVADADQKAAMQDAVDAAVALYVNMISVQKDEYDSLYVQDGMSMLLTAYDNTDSSLDLANGLWYNKAKVGVATIVGGLYNESSNKMGWQKGEKGIYWTQRASVSVAGQKNGIYFDINDLPAGEYTVEQVITYDGITNDDGTKWDSTWKYKGTDTGVSGYRYGHNVEAFAFGALRSLSFISNKHYKQQVDEADTSVNIGDPAVSFDGGQNRWYYTGLLYGEHGSNPTGYGSAVAGPNVESLWQNYAAGEVLTFTTTYDYVGGDTYDTATSVNINMLYDGAGKSYTVQAGTATNVEKYATTLLPNNAGFNKRGWDVYTNQKFHTMVGIAGNVYAIRVYDRVLTEAERAQNHAVDLMAYFKMDVEGFAAASEEAKAKVYEAFAEKTFAASDLEVSVMQAAIDRAVEDSIVGVIVSQKNTAGNALRIVGALETMENVSRVGFVITFKQNGEVVNTFGAATLENETTVTKTVFSSVTANSVTYSADDLCAEYLYAAVVKGVTPGTYTVEVTPFYVTLDDVVETGEMKSQEITFN